MPVRKVGDDKDVVRRATCRNCGSVLEYLPVDIKRHDYNDYDGTSDTDYYIECPECKARVVVGPR